MEPWVAIVLTGAAVAGYGWLLPAGNAKAAADAELSPHEETYDRLLDDLETENRELVDAVVQFKQEQDATVDRLGRQIRELERQMSEWKAGEPVAVRPAVVPAPAMEPEAHGASAGAAEASAPLPVAAADRPAAPDAAAPEPAAASSIRGRYAELISLYERGRSIEQIAKALQLNKGEVQLILQLAKREVGQRA